MRFDRPVPYNIMLKIRCAHGTPLNLRNILKGEKNENENVRNFGFGVGTV
jgi:hypothetical protein